MDLEEAKKIVCEAGLKLVKEGLVARTWGNISARVDSQTFVITPSGRAYEDLTPSDIVPVKIEDCSWSGTIKPSSEKGIHAGVYAFRDDINFVIHTHQKEASIVASARKDIPLLNSEMEKIIGKTVICGKYGLPGTKKLKAATIDALKRSGSKAALLANHGAVCIGKDMNEAFKVATTLEKISSLFIKTEFEKISNKKNATTSDIHNYYLKKYAGDSK